MDYSVTLSQEIVGLSQDTLGLSQETLALAQGILLGDKSHISPEVMQSFRTAGMSHLLAVSGLHVGIIMSLVWLLLKPLEWLVLYFTTLPQLGWRVGSPKTAYIIGDTKRVLVILLTVVYVWRIGAPPSAMRATLMLSLCLLGWMFHRPTSAARCLLFAALLLLAWDPWLITNVGFQLSFLAVGGILLFQPWLNDRSIHWSLRAILLSVAAQVLTIPVVAFYFYQVPFLGWLQGLLVVPLMPLFVTLLLLCLCFPSFSWLSFIVEALRAWMELMADSIGRLEQLLLGGHLYFFPSWLEALLAEIFFLALAILLRLRKDKQQLPSNKNQR